MIAKVAGFVSPKKSPASSPVTGARGPGTAPRAALADELAPAPSFRRYRPLLAPIAARKNFTSAGQGRLSVQRGPRSADEVLVNRETAAAFRPWAGRSPWA